MPSGTPKPLFVTYNAPSGPKRRDVGKVRPSAITLRVPSSATRTTLPRPAENGAGTHKMEPADS